MLIHVDFTCHWLGGAKSAPIYVWTGINQNRLRGAPPSFAYFLGQQFDTVRENLKMIDRKFLSYIGFVTYYNAISIVEK